MALIGTPVHTHEIAVDDALEFLDTLGYERGRPVDHLESTADALDWLRQRGLLHEPVEPELDALRSPGPAADAALVRVHTVRAALREVVDAVVEGRPARPTAVDEVNRAMAARRRLVLVAADSGLLLDHRHEGDPLDDALARIAEQVARTASSGEADRLRVCANDGCRWVFFDSSRTARRRWCDMSSCGNRAKAARHRARARGTPAPAPPA
jgi:predicted RNA-binding Zn ribbon-like protein